MDIYEIIALYIDRAAWPPLKFLTICSMFTIFGVNIIPPGANPTLYF